MIEIARVEPMVYRVPVETPVVTSFGTMRDRPALFVRVVDRQGREGWGEVWCNFPSVGAEHRARLIVETMAPLVVGRSWQEPCDVYAALTKACEVLAIQSGEPGPLAQAIAGIDIALWDLFAKAAGEPLYRYLGGRMVEHVPVYASGLNAEGPERLASLKRNEGYRRFKLKVGFGRDRDLANLRKLRDLLGDDATLMIDANQAWDVETAIGMARACGPFGLEWLEEPVRADVPVAEWARLATHSPIPLAAGENIRGEAAFAEAVAGMGLRYLQPDIGKWGGLSACRTICRDAVAAGLTYCPHWLGGGIGLVASLHLLAATGGDGALEVDSNPNVLREIFFEQLGGIEGGALAMPDGPGLGVETPLAGIERYRVRL